MRKVPLPNKGTPFFEADGKTVSQTWFDWFSYIDKRGIAQLSDVSPTAPTNGQTLLFNTTTGLWTPGAN